MTVLAIYPADPAPELAQLLDLSGFVWKGVAQPSDVDLFEPDEGWGGVVVVVVVAVLAWGSRGMIMGKRKG